MPYGPRDNSKPSALIAFALAVIMAVVIAVTCGCNFVPPSTEHKQDQKLCKLSPFFCNLIPSP
jgi:hypothetical protein